MGFAFLAIENPPVTHRAADFCTGSAFLCRVNYDTLIASVLSIALTIAIGFWVASRLQSRTPGRFQMVFEFLIDYTRQMIRDTIGVDVTFVMPLALTIFFYILVANWLGFLPIPHPFTPANADINQTLAMAAVVFLLAEGYSIKVRGFTGFLHHLTRPFELPIPVRVFFTMINIIEEIAKPLTLSLRLMGNIFGGLVMLWVLTILLPLVPIPVVPTVVSTALVVVWKLFDVLIIGTLQAFIFFLLTVIYFGQAREGLDEHGHVEVHETNQPVPATSH